MKVLVIRESVWGSIISDAFTFACIVLCWWINHRFFGGSMVIDIVLGIAFYVGVSVCGKKKYKPREAVDVLRELIRETNATWKNESGEPEPLPEKLFFKDVKAPPLHKCLDFDKFYKEAVVPLIKKTCVCGFMPTVKIIEDSTQDGEYSYLLECKVCNIRAVSSVSVYIAACNWNSMRGVK